MPGETEELWYRVTIRVPRDMSPEQVRQEMLTCISFGSPRVNLIRNPRLTPAQIRDWKPACWFWQITPEIVEMAAAVKSFAGAVSCLLEWMYACSVCGIMVGDLLADHCHESRHLRGMLCPRCNVLEPHHDGIFDLYRQETAAGRLSISARYIGS